MRVLTHLPQEVSEMAENNEEKAWFGIVAICYKWNPRVSDIPKYIF